MSGFDSAKVEAGARLMLEGFGVPETPDIKETPHRVAGYWREVLEGQHLTNHEIAARNGKRFVVDNPAMVVRRIDNVYSHCEHHLALMYNMQVAVAYLPPPAEGGGYYVIGLSKIPRIVTMCARRLQLQERLAADIAECLRLATGSPDVFVQITADHACVSARGARSEGRTDVVRLDGRFQIDLELRSEAARRAMV